MPKLIDIDVARAFAEERWPSPVARRCVDILLDNCPTVEVPEIVRCKDCKHWGTGYGGETDKIKVCEYANYMVGGNGYCVYGEQKEGATNAQTD